MKENIEQELIEDFGIQSGALKLTPEHIEKTVNDVLNNETGARVRIYAEICVHCGLCSNVCYFFLSRNKDPRFSMFSISCTTFGTI